jgi:hypothetical protein
MSSHFYNVPLALVQAKTEHVYIGDAMPLSAGVGA